MRKLAVTLALFTAACGLFGGSPKRVVSKYLDAVLAGRAEKAYALACDRDRTARALEAYKSGNPAFANPAVKALAGRASFKIQEVVVEGSRGTATVAVTHPDLGERTEEALAALLSAAPAPDLEAPEAVKDLEARAQSKDAPSKTTLRTIRLVKDPDGWRVYLGWEAQALVAEGRLLQRGMKLFEAIERYDKALAIDPDSVEARRAREDAETELRALRAKVAYMEHLEILGFKVGAGRNPAVLGRILNNGHRDVKDVEVTVYFLADDGRKLAEKTFHLLSATDTAAAELDRTLRRGGVKEFGYVIDGRLPAEWHGKARAEITNIELEGSL